MGTLSLTPKVYRTIHEVPANEWNSINSPNDIFHTHLFLTDLEDAKVERSEYWYLLIYSDGKLIATAVLSAFLINLDIFIQSSSFVRIVRNVWPGWLKIKILMCGIPASLGQKNIIIKENRNADEILDLIANLMDDISKKEKIKYLAFKEFKERELAPYEYLKRKHYFRALSLPYTKIEVKWGNFNEYLNALRNGYRRQILTSLKKIGVNAEFSLNENKGPDSEKPKLVLTDSIICTPQIFFDSYLEVMKRATSKLETLNLDFFNNYFHSHKENLVFIVLKNNFSVYGSAVLVPHGKELTFAFIGKQSDKDEYDTYFNLIIAIVKYGIDNHFTSINMGQTSYYPKLRVGAKTEAEYIYFRSRKFFMHGLLKMLNKVIFPKTKFIDLNAFKNKTNA